jgi:hypothetical protein
VGWLGGERGVERKGHRDTGAGDGGEFIGASDKQARRKAKMVAGGGRGEWLG